MRRRPILLLSFLFTVALSAQPVATLWSPARVLKLETGLQNGQLFYRLWRFNRPVLDDSHLGFVLKNAAGFDGPFELVKTDQREVDETWQQVWGEKQQIRNHYRELRLDLARAGHKEVVLQLVFRVYDDGLGFRYIFPEQPGLKQIIILDERTEFNFSQDYSAWWIKAYQPNRYEYLYRNTPLSTIDTVHTPLTMVGEDGLCVSIHEAALTDYASMTLARKRGTLLEADLVPWSDGVRVRGQSPLKTPWRTLQIVDTPGELITNYLILNLNEPNRLDDVSWIKPGKYLGIWWEMH
ncbi:MAG: glycoside hydrolase family 97 protein, partial [Calditrichaeota bacterium]